MSSNVFRSSLMQQFARTTSHRSTPSTSSLPTTTTAGAALRTTRTSHFHSKLNGNIQPTDHDHPYGVVATSTNTPPIKKNENLNHSSPTDTAMTIARQAQQIRSSNSCLGQTSHHFSTKSFAFPACNDGGDDDNNQNIKQKTGDEKLHQFSSSQSFQNVIQTRRTATRFSPLEDLSQSQQKQISDAMYRSIECAIQAPNHYRTEPTTYYRIMPHTTSWEKLLDITYNVTFLQAFNKKSSSNKTKDEAMMNAESKREKWRNTIGGYIVVCVGGQAEQQNVVVDDDECANNNDGDHDDGDDDDDEYEIIPLCPPETERQMEDYASACASIQNMLLSLHSEGIATKVRN